jgi:hypothetical protein
MYPITMTFVINSENELTRLVRAATTQNEQATLVADTVAKQAVATAVKEVKKPDPKPEKAAAASAPPADTPDTPEPTAAASTIDYEKDVKPAFLKLVQTKGRAAGRKIIDAFAPTKDKLSEAITTPEQFAQALNLIAKEML